MGPKRQGSLITEGKQPTKKPRALPDSFRRLTEDDVAASAAMSWIPAQHNPEPLVPKRPDSQKAATMASEPSQSDVEMLCMVTSCDPSTARRYLKVSRCLPQMLYKC